jgi:hypothetical protein
MATLNNGSGLLFLNGLCSIMELLS